MIEKKKDKNSKPLSPETKLWEHHMKIQGLDLILIGLVILAIFL